MRRKRVTNEQTDGAAAQNRPGRDAAFAPELFRHCLPLAADSAPAFVYSSAALVCPLSFPTPPFNLSFSPSLLSPTPFPPLPFPPLPFPPLPSSVSLAYLSFLPHLPRLIRIKQKSPLYILFRIATLESPRQTTKFKIMQRKSNILREWDFFLLLLSDAVIPSSCCVLHHRYQNNDREAFPTIVGTGAAPKI